MPLVIRTGDITQGHTIGPGINVFATQVATKVLADGKGVVVTGDQFGVHGYPGTPPTTHSIGAGPGSPTVFAGGMPVWRSRDKATCGDTALALEGSVYADGI